MDYDFSKINLEYLIKARDLARSNQMTGSIFLGIPDELAQLFSRLPSHELALLTELKIPLVGPRYEAWWWDRLLKALQGGDSEELRVLIEHTGMFIERGSV